MKKNLTESEPTKTSWIEKLYNNPKTNKFSQHLIKSFCNKHYVYEKENIKDAFDYKKYEKGIASKLSDKTLSETHYNELIKFVEKQLLIDDKLVQLMVEYVKADIMLECILEKYPSYSKEFEYKDLPTKMKSYIALVCRLPKESVFDGRSEEAWNILSRKRKLSIIPKVKIDTYLMINKMVHQKTSTSGTAIGSLLGEDILKKLRK